MTENGILCLTKIWKSVQFVITVLVLVRAANFHLFKMKIQKRRQTWRRAVIEVKVFSDTKIAFITLSCPDWAHIPFIELMRYSTRVQSVDHKLVHQFYHLLLDFVQLIPLFCSSTKIQHLLSHSEIFILHEYENEYLNCHFKSEKLELSSSFGVERF